MNIENKKTALDDDASIYQRVESTESAKTERQKLSELSFKGKLRYLWDYYALTAFLVLLFGGLIVAVLVTVLRHKPTTEATIIFIDDVWQPETIESYADDLLKQVRPDADDSVISVTNGYRSSSSNDALAISTRIFAQEIDLIVAPKEFLESYAENDSLCPFDILPDDLKRAFAGRSRLTTDKASDEGTHDYAVSLADTPFLRTVNGDAELPAEYYVGICRSTLEERYDIIFDILRVMVGQ